MESVLVGLVKEGGIQVVLIIICFVLLRNWLTTNSQALTANTTEIRRLSHAMVKLEVQLEMLIKLSGRVDRLEKGMNVLFKNGGEK